MMVFCFYRGVNLRVQIGKSKTIYVLKPSKLLAQALRTKFQSYMYIYAKAHKHIKLYEVNYDMVSKNTTTRIG